MTRNAFLRVVAGADAIAVSIVAANYYLQLGWFGPWARAALGGTMFLSCLFLAAAFRLWSPVGPEDR
jgi:hypothetical protein